MASGADDFNQGIDAASFYKIVEARRSIRAFEKDPIPNEVLKRCIDAACRAPSASNLQPWEFVLLTSDKARAEALKVCLGQRVVQSAPTLVALVAHWDTVGERCRFILDTLEGRGILRPSQKRYWGRQIPFIYTSGPFGLVGLLKRSLARLISLLRPSPNFYNRCDLRVMTHKSTALAAATFMLALKAEGYDSCPLEGFDPWRARRLLDLPRNAETCMFIAIGKGKPEGLWWERILAPESRLIREI